MLTIAKWVFVLFFMHSAMVLAYAQAPLCEQQLNPKQADYRVIQMICEPPPEHPEYRFGDTDLSNADSILNGYYRAALGLAQDRAALQADQRAWLRERNVCLTYACLNEAYHFRIFELTFLLGISKLHHRGIFTFDRESILLLTRGNGLQYLDGGKQDYDYIHLVHRGKYDQDRGCMTGATFGLLGGGVVFEETCEPPEPRKPFVTAQGFRFTRIVTYSSWLLKGVLHDWSRLIEERVTSIWDADAKQTKEVWEPFDTHISRYLASGERVWRYFVVWKAIPEDLRDQGGFWGRNRKYGNVGTGSLIYLADKSILTATGFRLNPLTGDLYEKTRLRRFTETEVSGWKKVWAQDYLAQHPECGEKMQQCHDKTAASAYLRERFEAEMERQFSQAYR